MLALAVAIAFAVGPQAAASGCGGSSTWSSCDVTNTGSSVEIGVAYDEPGAGDVLYGDESSGAGRGTDPSDPDAGTPGGSAGGADGASAIPEGCADVLCRPSYSVEMLPTVTLSDVASFAPASAVVEGEPDGFGIVGMPVNFVAAATTHTVAGELFSRPVTVRFTPVAYVFDHGDGSTRTSPTGGTTWAALGVPQFSATATSHPYTARGVYAARVIVQYTAATDFGTGWRDIPGTLEIPGPTTEITILEARTALVHHSCTERPTAPAC